MKKIVLKKDVKTQDEECEDKSTKNSEIKRNNENLSKDTAFSINDYNSTMNTIKPLESQSEIVSHRIRNEMEILESGRMIQTEISSPDGNFDCHRRVEIIGGEMIQSVDIAENGNLKKDTIVNERSKKEKNEKDIDTIIQENDDLQMKKVKIKPDEFTKQIKENDISLEDDPFIIN